MRVCRRGRYSRRTWISCLLRWITEYLFRLNSYNESDLFLGLSVFGVKNRIGYELAQFSLDAYSVLSLRPIQFSVLKIPTSAQRFQRPAFKLFPIYREIMIWDILSYQIVLNFEEDQHEWYRSCCQVLRSWRWLYFWSYYKSNIIYLTQI